MGCARDCLGRAALLLALAAALTRSARGDLPNCTFEACPVCLPDARTSLSNLTLFGPDDRYHRAPLRIGRAAGFWDINSAVATIVGILVAEQLGVQVEYIPIEDDSQAWFGVNNCIGWEDLQCDTWEVHGDAGLRRKMHGDALADIMFAGDVADNKISPRTTAGTELDWDTHPGVDLGPAGFTDIEGLFVPAEVVSAALVTGLDLRWFPDYELPGARSYFDRPQRLADEGVVAEVEGCASNASYVQDRMDSLTAMGFTCNSSWWLNPACTELGDKWTTECIVMLDDSWTYWKQEVYTALAHSRAPIAKVAVGYDIWPVLILSEKYKIFYNWWSPDASITNHPEFVRMPMQLESKPSIGLKVVWGPVMEADPKVSWFLKAVSVKPDAAEVLMQNLGAAYRSGMSPGAEVFQKVICDWLRERRDVWSDWMPSAKSCVAGQVFDAAAQHCVPCPRGSAAAAHKPVCLKCAPGTFTEVEGALECSACIPGQFSTVTGASTGSVCQRCPEGTFASGPGRSGCEGCNETFTTLFPGATGSSECTCGVGRFLRVPASGDVEQAVCTDCVHGLVCPGGHQRPLQAAGFAAADFAVGGPKAIVACSSDIKCPGGTPLGSCPEHHEGVACDGCAAGFFERDGRCTACDARKAGLMVGPLAVSLVAGGGLVVRAVRHRVGVGTSSAATLMLTCSLTVSTLQMVTSFDKLLRNWPEPLASLYRVLRLFNIDLNVLGLGCVVRLGRPEVSYLGSLLLHPTFAVALAVSVLALRPFGWRVPLNEFINMQGMVVSSVYIALTIISLRPWQCDANPDGTSSVATNRAVICWSTSAHRLMIGLSMVALFVYVLGAFALAVWATWVYPSKIHGSGGEAFIRRFRFLHFRFNPEHYWFVMPFMLRSLLVSVLPVVLVNEPSMCLMFLILVLSVGCGVQCWVQPWREIWVNYLDALASLCILLLLAGGALVVDDDVHHTEDMVKYFYMVLILALGCCLATVAVSALWRWLVPSLTFGIFLCHHKDAAAILARWFKMVLADFTSERIFLDSDELDRLDKIFHIVARETKHLVALLTEQTMQRIWCAGEMATAVRYRVDIQVVACSGYTAPSDEFIDGIARLWTEEQQNQAFALGVCIQDIQDGYRAIRDMPALVLDRELPQASQELVVHRVFKQCRKLRGTSTGRVHRLRFAMAAAPAPAAGAAEASGGGRGYVVVAGDMEDPEAAMACAVIARLLARELAVAVSVLQSGETSLAKHTGTRFLLAALSRNALRNAAFAATLVDAEKHSLECIPIITDSHFHVPGAAFWQARDGRSTDEWPDQALLRRHETSVEEVAGSYRRLFNVLAMRFSSSGSSRIQATEIKELVPRFRRTDERNSRKSNEATPQTLPLVSPKEGLQAFDPEQFVVEPEEEEEEEQKERGGEEKGARGGASSDLVSGIFCQTLV